MRAFLLLFVFELAAVPISHPAIADERSFSATLLLGAPHPLNLGLDCRFTPAFSAGILGGGFGLPFNDQNGNKYTLAVSNAEFRVRWHPWNGAILLGLGLGYQLLHGTASIPVIVQGQTIPTLADATIMSLYLTPHLGWFWVFSGGFTLGFEIGVQFPISPNTTIDTSISDPTLNSYLTQVKGTAAYQQLQADIVAQGDRYGRSRFPYVTALRVGWSF